MAGFPAGSWRSSDLPDQVSRAPRDARAGAGSTLPMPGELTAELRWWWPGEAPAAVAAWFARLGPGAEESRSDAYLLTGSAGLGLKRRGEGGGIEVKCLVAACPAETLPAPAELWVKHAAEWGELPAGATIEVAKTRRLFPFAGGAGESGCDVELASIRADGAEWSSLCFEAAASLADPAGALLAAWQALAPPLDAALGRAASYPAWLLAPGRPRGA